MNMLRRWLMGFLAGALAVIVFHQGFIWVLNVLDFWNATPWSVRATGPWNVPVLFNQMFWGGLWGMGYVMLSPALPGNSWWIRGAFWGLVVVGVGNFLLVPLIKGLALFAGGDPERIFFLTLIHVVFGVGVAFFLKLFGSSQ